MDTFLFILKIIAGPLIGAVIGYLTNWLAVKMLFRPYYPKKIGKFTLPFTPGIIPKRKQALAQAVGKAVGEQLFTKDDIKSALSSESTKQAVVDYALESIRSLGDKSVENIADSVMPDVGASALTLRAEDALTDKIYSTVQNARLGDIVAAEADKFIMQKKSSLGMISMFITEDLISSLTDKLRDGVENYVQNNGKELIRGEVQKELGKAVKAPLAPVIEKIDEKVIAQIVGKIYDEVISGGISRLLDNIDIQGIVEKKLNDMDVKDLEKLVLSVMKKELKSIVNLGALIGFVLGIIMIFI
jgi:uncharacterized membrane protein YheB (UPF0754 family)